MSAPSRTANIFSRLFNQLNGHNSRCFTKSTCVNISVINTSHDTLSRRRIRPSYGHFRHFFGTETPINLLSPRYNRSLTGINQVFRNRAEMTKNMSSIHLREHDQEYIAIWQLKSNLENVYLSWCRNGYILTMAAAAINYQSLIPSAPQVAAGMVAVAFLSITYGYGSYVFALNRLCRTMAISRTTLVTPIMHGAVMWLIWISAMSVYLGYVLVTDEGLEDDEFIKIVHIDLDKHKNKNKDSDDGKKK